MKSRPWLKLGNLCREQVNLIDQLTDKSSLDFFLIRWDGW
uniref:Uncharacterized protein n=1 Tax=Arundo donax TaxID=35708 RepID=A0A0A9FWA4_ARUDO